MAAADRLALPKDVDRQRGTGVELLPATI